MKLLIIEDEAQLAESIVQYFQREGYHCEVASKLDEAIDKVMLHTYDCILLDITLPDGSGLKILEHIQGKGMSDGVIIISARDSLDDRISGLRLGADDYMAKPFHLSELSARVGALIRRKVFQGSNKVVFRELTIEVQSQVVKLNGDTLVLTRKEYDLLLFLISNKGRIISKNAIAEHLSGDMADMLDNYGFVYAHMKNLKKKLSEGGCREYIKTIYGFGYQWNHE
jgi:DNA-binding response OmpR family regulator